MSRERVSSLNLMFLQYGVSQTGFEFLVEDLSVLKLKLKYRIIIGYIYTIILLKSVCRCSQTAGRNYCSIVSGNVSNGSYRLTVYPVTSSRLN